MHSCGEILSFPISVRLFKSFRIPQTGAGITYNDTRTQVLLHLWLVGRADEFRRAKKLHASMLTIDSHCDTNELVSQKDKLTADLAACIAEQDSLYKYLTSIETEYQKAKEGAQQSAALNKRISDITTKIEDIIKRAAQYAEDIKGFMENVELNIFLPKMASNLSVEINNILRIKGELQQSSTGAYSLETLRDVSMKVIEYLKELSLCSPEVDEENVVSHLVAVQNTTNKQDPFDFLDAQETAALKSLVSRGANNQ